MVGVAGWRRRHHRPVVVGLARGRWPRLADEVDLAGADEHVVADPALEHPHRALHVGGHEAGEVHRGVEAPAGQRAVEVVRRAIALEALDPIGEGIGQAAAVEEGHVVAAGQEAPDEVVADEAVSPDDEDVQGAAAAATRSRSSAGT